MGSYRLSRLADADIEAIAADSLQQWGLAQAGKYLQGLHATFGMLAEFPDLGKDASHVRAGYRKIESGRHSVFYRKIVDGVLIVRVLHQRMDFARHL